MGSGILIPVEIQEIYRSNQPLELLNMYKGIPISTQAIIEGFSNNTIQMQARPPESTCLAVNSSTLIRHAMLPHPIKAKILNYDPRTNQVELGGLQEVNARFMNREQIRVEPRYMVSVNIENGSQRVVGTLTDISLEGVGIYISSTAYEYALLRADTVSLSMHLPGGWVQARGKIKVTGKSIDYCRLSIHFADDEPVNPIIQRYIATRREEILVELYNHFDEAYRIHPPGRVYQHVEK